MLEKSSEKKMELGWNSRKGGICQREKWKMLPLNGTA